MPSLSLLFFFGREIKNVIIIHLSLHSEAAWFHYLTDLQNSCNPQTAPSSPSLITNYLHLHQKSLMNWMQAVWQNCLVIFCALFSRLSVSSRALSETRCLNSFLFHTFAHRTAGVERRVHRWLQCRQPWAWGAPFWGRQCTVWSGRIIKNLIY